MRILLDESVPERLGDLLSPHQCSSVRRQGWAGLKNGKLLAVAAEHFDVLLTADKNMEFQQNLVTLPLGIAVMRANSNRLEALAELVPALLRSLEHFRPRTLVKIVA